MTDLNNLKQPLNKMQQPFMAPFEIEAFSIVLQGLDKPLRALEWGSGRSTVYFYSMLPFGSIWLAIEHNPVWCQSVRGELNTYGCSGAEVILIPPDRPYVEGFDDGDFATFRSYVLAPARLGERFDLILVDGRARVACMAVGWDLLTEDGVMVLHDAQRSEYDDGVPQDAYWIRLTHPRKNREGLLSFLIMAKNSDVARRIYDRLRQVLPPFLMFSTNILDEHEQLPGALQRLIALKEKQGQKIQFTQMTPSVFSIETTLGCNLRCPECAIGCGKIGRKPGVMSFESFKVIADKIEPYCKYLLLHNWGEPLLNKDIFEIISYASRFTATNISTNGQLVDEEKAERLIASGVTDILVSIDGMSQDVYGTYRVGGEVAKALNALLLLNEANKRHGNHVRIIPQFIVFEHNQHEVKQFEQFCQNLGLEPFFKAPYLMLYSCFNNGFDARFCRTRYPDPESQRHAMKDCPDPKKVFTILLDGSVVICCNDYNEVTTFGNIYEQSVADIWDSEKYTNFRWAIVSGNAPRFCLENCLSYLPDYGTSGRFPIQSKSRIVFVNTCYGAYIEEQYSKNPALANASYIEQLTILKAGCFGDSYFYSRGLAQAGWDAVDLILNADILQRRWAYEHGYVLHGDALFVEQIRQLQPDVLYIQDMNRMYRSLIEEIRPYVSLVVGQIATPVFKEIPFQLYDFVISSFPHYVDKLRAVGVTAYYQALAFEPSVLEILNKFDYSERPVACSFVGGISGLHKQSYMLLELLALNTITEFWGYGVETLPEDSPVRRRHNGIVWGSRMFDVMAASRITVNRHGEVAENYANNMRLFEATGCGALLITDYKDNLHELFEIGREVVVYRSPEECVDLVNYYLARPKEAEAIAKAGQQRTLRDHTYALRMKQTAEFLGRYLRYREEDGKFILPERVSSDYRNLEADEEEQSLTQGWRSADIPVRQRGLVQYELARMYRGDIPAPFFVLSDMLKPFASTGMKILELGCASGYYYEVLEYLLGKRIEFTGVDYSEAMIEMARDYYPAASFFAADARCLFFADRSFDVVVSSSILLHVPNYREHLEETIRVAADLLVLHRTPVCRSSGTRRMVKKAYGVETLELRFNESEILNLVLQAGFELVDAREIDANLESDEYCFSYLLKRVSK